jgi:hypothetical protein
VLEGLFLVFSSVWLITIRDVAPVIGVIILAIILIVLFVIIFEFYRYMVKKGMEQYEREHGHIPP